MAAPCSKSEPARWDFMLWRGNNDPPIKFRFRDVDLTGAIARLQVALEPDPVVYSSAESGSVITIEVESGSPMASTVTFHYPTAFTRALPQGRGVKYELEILTDDTERTVVRGFMEAEGGDNPDG